MARYIDADAFLRRIESMYCLGCEKRMGIKNGKKKFIYGIGGVPCRACEVDDMKDEIDNAPTADVVEIKKEGEWEMFDLISSAYYGKMMYFKQDNGTVYSRCSSTVMHFDEAIREFISLIDDSDFPDVVERKRGKWTDRKVIEDGKAIEEWQYARCSVCGNYHTTPYMYYFNDFAYCPWCGAEMGERRTDDDRNG